MNHQNIITLEPGKRSGKPRIPGMKSRFTMFVFWPISITTPGVFLLEMDQEDDRVI
jgi:hypothetical protein